MTLHFLTLSRMVSTSGAPNERLFGSDLPLLAIVLAVLVLGCRARVASTSARSPFDLGLQVARNGPTFRGGSRGVMRHHAARLPVPGQHHVGGRRAPARQFRRQPNPPGSARSRGLTTPAAWAAVVNRNPIICADNGTTQSPGCGLVAARSVRMARATPSFTNRTSFTSPS